MKNITAIKVWHAKDLGYDGWHLMYRDEKGIAQYPTETDYEFDFVESKYLDEAVKERDELIVALTKTPCTGNGLVHVESCFKCSVLEKFVIR